MMVFVEEIYFSIFLLLYHGTLFYAVHIVYNYVRTANMLIIFIIFNRFSLVLCYMCQYFYFLNYKSMSNLPFQKKCNTYPFLNREKQNDCCRLNYEKVGKLDGIIQDVPLRKHGSIYKSTDSKVFEIW